MSHRLVTQWQRDYIVAHINDRPRTDVARAAGVSVHTVYRLVREHGGELRHELATRRPDAEDIVRRCYPVMATADISAKYGISHGTVNKIAAELGVTHGPEVLRRMGDERNARLAAAREATDREEAQRKRRITRRMDELRFLSGQPQRTRFRFKAMPVRIHKAKWHLCRKYGYMADGTDAYTLRYGGGTRRVREAYYEGKYKLTFKPEET